MRTNTTLAPLEFVDLASADRCGEKGWRDGMVFMTSMAVASSKNFNFMEGCFHYYDEQRAAFPGMLLSTGMEDFFDSAFYFDAGAFHLPVSGNTHMTNDDDSYQWSGYRFFEMDPIVFSDGFRFQWRNGDVTDPATGLKCTLDQGGATCGDPQPSHVEAYTWVYMWPPNPPESGGTGAEATQ